LISKITTCLSFLLLLLLAAPAPSLADDAHSGNITVAIMGLRNNQGVVRVALFGSKETYNNDHNIGMGSYRKMVAPIESNCATATFSDIPFGDYAIKVFHDQDNSGKFVTNAFGIPKVEYAFSNNARAMFRPPSYDKAKFVLDRAGLSMEIKTQGK
jgi:uncharacterized protein (DUF2141 family)